MSTRAIPTPRPITLHIDNPSGSIEVVARSTDETTVEITPGRGDRRSEERATRTEVRFADDELRIEVPRDHGLRMIGDNGRVRIRVTLPDGSSVRTRSASADVTVRGRVDSLDAHAASGDITAEEVDGEVETKTASGDIRLGRVAGQVRSDTASGDVRIDRAGGLAYHTASGDVRAGTVDGHVEGTSASGDCTVERVGSAEVRSASGDLRFGDAAESVTARAVSGDITLGCVRTGTITLQATSGNLSIGLAPDTLAHLDVQSRSGRVRSDLPTEEPADTGGPAEPQGTALSIRARSVSGNITVHRASARSGR